MNTDALRLILERFTAVQTVDRSRMGGKNKGNAAINIKFVKTKEKSKVLMCHIVAAAMHLSTQKRMLASILVKTLKKEM